MIQQMLAIWSLVSLPLQNPACTSGSSQFTYCWHLAWRILSIILLACEVSAILWEFESSKEHSLNNPSIPSKQFIQWHFLGADRALELGLSWPELESWLCHWTHKRAEWSLNDHVSQGGAGAFTMSGGEPRGWNPAHEGTLETVKVSEILFCALNLLA